MNVEGLDLNLLRSLDALLRMRSVTRAAGRLGLSQPALSAALAKLRRHFGDELLVRAGNTYSLTPLALQLIERTGVALSGVERVFSARAEFDAHQCTREFTVLTSDYALTVFGATLVDVLGERAPRARLRFVNHSRDVVDNAVERLRTADVIILPHGFLTGLPHQDIYQDRWVCIVADDHPAVAETLTMAELSRLPWVVTFHEPTAYTPAGRQMQLLGIDPWVQVITDGFLPVPGLVAGSDRIALLQERLARGLAPDAGIRIVECPFDALPLVEALWWHPLSELDPEHQMLRAAAAEASRRLTGGPLLPS